MPTQQTPYDYINSEQKTYKAELLQESKKIYSGQSINWKRVCCIVTQINIVRFFTNVYDHIVYGLLVALDMHPDDEIEEVSVVLLSRRIRGWYIIFGFSMLGLASALMIGPAATLRFLGWEEEDIDSTCARLLSATLAALAIICIRSANTYMPSYHVLISDAAALVCAAFVVAVISVTVTNSDVFEVGHVVTLCVFMGVTGMWMYCRGLVSSSSEYGHAP